MMNRFREPVSGFLHLGGALLAFIATIVIVAATWHTPDKMISLLVYGISLVLLFSASTALHLTRGSQQTMLWLDRFDHSAIYVLIAGTYTPFCYNMLDGAWRWGMLLVVWGLAVIGIVYKLGFHRKKNYISTVLYVAMGWIAVLAAPKFLPLVPIGALILLAAGGIVYSVGAVVYALQKPNLNQYFGYHELWHVFVLAGSAIQFLAVVRYIAFAA